MSALKSRLQDDLTAAMKARDELTTATLRMAMTAITNEEVAGKEQRVLSDEEVLVVLGREAKKRRESAEAYTAAGRTDLADREQAELAVLGRYLPQPLTDDEVRGIVAAAVAQVGVSGPQAMGAVMKVVQPQVRGRADGAAVAALVREALGA